MIALETTKGLSWHSLAALKKRVVRLSYSVICLYPVAEKIAPVFDDLVCSYRNEGSIPFTRSIRYQALTTDCSRSAVKGLRQRLSSFPLETLDFTALPSDFDSKGSLSESVLDPKSSRAMPLTEASGVQ